MVWKFWLNDNGLFYLSDFLNFWTLYGSSATQSGRSIRQFTDTFCWRLHKMRHPHITQKLTVSIYPSGFQDNLLRFIVKRTCVQGYQTWLLLTYFVDLHKKWSANFANEQLLRAVWAAFNKIKCYLVFRCYHERSILQSWKCCSIWTFIVGQFSRIIQVLWMRW